MSNRPYDIVLYGASGFVGQQTVQYFTQHPYTAQLTWAIAGRNRQKLETIKQQTGANVDLLIADSQDQAALDAIASQTRVLLTTAGPFALYGTPLVDACVRCGTHYVDITGETPWVKRLITRYHEQAANNGTRIIPFCGFDSIPSDLGTYLVVRHLQQTFNIPCTQVKAYYQVSGGFNGGTLASGFNLYDSGDIQQMSDPFILNPPETYSPEQVQKNQDPTLPQYDADIAGWVAPFLMGFVNSRVVRRSSALFEQWGESYGTDFTYQEYAKFDPPLDGLQATAMTASMALFTGAFQYTPIRHFLQSLLPQPGSGPSEKIKNEGWFRGEFLGFAGKDPKVKGLIYDQGDPGNRATVKFLCEAALSLALNEDELPGGKERGGILTPATALGEVLVERLRRAGMQIKIETI